jgi:uncharacterized membrane protein
MWKTHKTTIIITVLLCLVPIAAGAVLWDRLPDPMPVHFGPDNQPNGWASRPFAVFGLPCFIAALELVCVALTNLDPKRRNIPRKNMALVLWMMPALSVLTGALTYAYALGRTVDIGFFVMLALGLLFLVLGNLLPKAGQNYSYGIKLPWTLHDEDNWCATHRFGGYVFAICGVLMMATAFLHNPWVTLGLLLVMLLAPTVYSYLYYRRHQ